MNVASFFVPVDLTLPREKMEKAAFPPKATAHPTRAAVAQLLAANDCLSVSPRTCWCWWLWPCSWLGAAASVSRSRQDEVVLDEELHAQHPFNYPLILGIGLVMGTLTGFVGPAAAS